MKLQDLAVDHDYYCSDSNYYSNQASQRYDTMTDFLNDFESADVDMNLMFRWDVREYCQDYERTGFYAECFLMLQRKGIFMPCHIERFEQSEVDRFVEYAKKHKAKIDLIWQPL